MPELHLPPPAESRVIFTHVDGTTRRLMSAILREWFTTQGTKSFTVHEARVKVNQFTEHQVRNDDQTKQIDRNVSQALAVLASTPSERIVRVGSANSGQYRMVGQNENLAQIKKAQPVKTINRGGEKKVKATRPLSQLCGAGECLKVLTAKDDTVLVQSESGEVYRAVLELVAL